MIQRARNGVDVAGVFDKTLGGGQGAELGTLFCAKVPVRQDGNPQFMHNKVIIIDERYVVTGSLASKPKPRRKAAGKKKRKVATKPKAPSGRRSAAAA